MITKLKGILDEISDEGVVIDTQGVCYGMACSKHTLGQLPKIGSPVALYIESSLRNEMIYLCGFYDIQERNSFRMLITVQGVGIKVALAILSILDHERLIKALQDQDQALLSQAEGVGPKLATRIVTELKGKVKGLVPIVQGLEGVGPAMMGLKIPTPTRDAISALVNLGYRMGEATEVIERLIKEQGPQTPLHVLIRTGLQHLAK